MPWKFCPHCGGTLPPDLSPSAPAPAPETPVGRAGRYDQTMAWKSLLKEADEWRQRNPGRSPSITDLAQKAHASCAARLSAQGGDKRSVVHLLFDRPVVPQGVLLPSIVSMGKLIERPEKLQLMGYSMEDGRVQLVDDVPVGPIYNLLQYWGGARQHKRWHLSQPIEVDPSRIGNPSFMDENMVAFVATWSDGDRIVEALENLGQVLAAGTQSISAVGEIMALSIGWL